MRLAAARPGSQSCHRQASGHNKPCKCTRAVWFHWSWATQSSFLNASQPDTTRRPFQPGRPPLRLRAARRDLCACVAGEPGISRALGKLSQESIDATRTQGFGTTRAPAQKRQLKRGASSGASASAPSDALVKVWVKPMDVEGAQYAEVEDVDLHETVSNFKARWVAQEELAVDPSVVKLRLVECGSRMPTLVKEKATAVLGNPSLSLAESGITGTAWLLADIIGTPRFANVSLHPRAPAAVEAFWQQLPKATVEGNVMRLAGGTTFLGSGLPNSSSMYIRDDYVGLWSEVQRLFTDENFTRIVISGNPGIGKSFFGFWIAFKIMTRGTPVTIVWEECLNGTRTLIRNGCVSEGSLQDFRIELSDKNAWYLVDECVPPGPWRVLARTLVFSPPERDNYRRLLKTRASTIRYLPAWNWGEIDACRNLLFVDDPVRTLAAVKSAYDRWGGIPRFVLEKVGEASAQSELDKAFVRIRNWDTLLDSVGAIDSASEASHHLLHIVPSPCYEMLSVKFESDYITSRVSKLLVSKQRDKLKLISFVSRECDPLYSSLRGVFFEMLAHKILAAGGEFRTRMLDLMTIESNVKMMPPRQVQRFHGNKPKDLALLFHFSAQASYFQPFDSNFPVLDAIVLPKTLYQMTLSWNHEHEVDESKLAEIMDILQLEEEKIEIVFVLPADNLKFDIFKPYKFKDTALGQRVIQSGLRALVTLCPQCI